MPTIAELIERLRPLLTEKRFTHSLAVMEQASLLAAHWGADVEKAKIAGLLHDVARGLPQDELLRYARQAGFDQNPDYQASPVLLHAPIGAYLLRQQWGIDDQEILTAVERHTLASPEMSLLDKLVYLADIIAPGREFSGLAELRQLAFSDLDAAMAASIKQLMDWLGAKNKPPAAATEAAYQYYKHSHRQS